MVSRKLPLFGMPQQLGLKVLRAAIGGSSMDERLADELTAEFHVITKN